VQNEFATSVSVGFGPSCRWCQPPQGERFFWPDRWRQGSVLASWDSSSERFSADQFPWLHCGLSKPIRTGAGPLHSCRRTLCVSKTDHMHDLVIGLFINRYEFGRALW